MFRTLRPYQVVVDVTAAVLFALVVSPIEVALVQGTGLARIFVALVVVTILSLALALRRVSPGLALGVAWTGAIVQMVAGLDPSVVDVAIFAVLYATAAYGDRVTYWAGFASAFAGAVVITAYLLVLRTTTRLTLADLPLALALLLAATFALLLAWVTGALVRTALRARDARRAREAAEAEAVTEQERVRIARDMHDVVAHSLAVVIAQADGARYAAASDPGAATTALETISRTARAALADVRMLLTQLRHSEGEGPQPTLADVEGLYAQVRAAGVDLAVDVDPAPPGEAPAAVQLAVYRILQEALTNALRHGSGGRVTVRLAWLPGHVDLEVRNPRAAAAAAAPAGHGLIGMRERAQLVGGTLEAAPDGDEFVVRAAIPIREGSMSIRVVLVDDQALFRAGIRMVIDSQPDLEVVGEAADGAEGLEVIAATGPDVVLMDIRMPRMDGLTATAELLSRPDPPRVVMLTTFDLDEAAARAIRQGASGFLLKDADPEFLLAAIRTVHAGSAVIAASATRELFAASVAPARPVPASYGTLTDREREVFALAARGLSNAEIAAQEFLSEATVKTHISRILTKLSLRDRVQLVVFAYDHGLA